MKKEFKLKLLLLSFVFMLIGISSVSAVDAEYP